MNEQPPIRVLSVDDHAFLSKPPARKLLGRIALHWKQGIGTSAEDCEL